MAPKKKPTTANTASTSAAASTPATATATGGDVSMDTSINEADQSTNQLAAGIDQFELPKSVVTKIAKAEIPSNFVIRKDTTTALVKSSSVFISYLTAAAHEVAQKNGKKTIMASHVLEAMEELEFPKEMFGDAMKEHLEGYRSKETEKKASKNASRKSDKKGRRNSTSGSVGTSASLEGEGDGDGGGDLEDEEMNDGEDEDADVDEGDDETGEQNDDAMKE